MELFVSMAKSMRVKYTKILSLNFVLLNFKSFWYGALDFAGKCWKLILEQYIYLVLKYIYILLYFETIIDYKFVKVTKIYKYMIDT